MRFIGDHMRLNRLITLGVLVCGLALRLSAQINTDTMGVDDLFSIAREKAFNKQREEARAILRIILQRSPSYKDVHVLIGRTYAWDGKYDSARIELNQVIHNDPTYADAYNALIDVELWSNQFAQALTYTQTALQYYPSNEDFLLKKARGLKNLGRDHEALNVLNKLQDIHPSAAGVESMREEISTKTMLQSIGMNYAVDAFSEQRPMQYTYLQYSRRTPYGSVFARVNYSSRFEEGGTQLEFDFYPRIADGKYAYVNYGFSNSSLFPNHRLGGEFFFSLPASFEGSLGFRYLYFGPGSSVAIYTGSLGYYLGNYWVSLRPYITPGDAGLSKSASLTIRYFFGDVEDYFTFRFGAGFTPDERSIQSSVGFGTTEVFTLDSQTFGIGIQTAVGIHYLFIASIDFSNQEKSYDPGNYLKMYSFSAGLKLRF
jgi:YaiO family outer membrane protein